MAQEQALTPGNGAINALVDSSGDNDSGAEFDPAVVEKAQRQGWKPKDQFDGPDEEWVSPDLFLERAQQINPILRAKNARMESRLEKQERELSELRTTVQAFQKTAVSQTRTEIESRLAGLRKEKAEAISNGDGEKVNELDERIDKDKQLLSEHQERKPTAEQTQPPPELVDAMNQFRGQFAWLGKDARKTHIAAGLANVVRDEYPHLVGKPEFFTQLAKEIRAQFGGADNRSNMVDGTGNGSGGGSGKNFHSLPRDVQEVCDRMVSQKLFKDRAAYVKAYYEQEEDGR